VSALRRASALVVAALVPYVALGREVKPEDRPVDPAVAAGEWALIGKSAYWRSGSWRESAYHLLWKRWGLSSRPADFEEQVRRRYGLVEAPYANDGLPMGLRFTKSRYKGERTITQDCLLCHGGRIAGRVMVGLPNTQLSAQQLSDDLDAVDGRNPHKAPFDLGAVRGLNNADSLAVLLTSFRNRDMSWDVDSLMTGQSPDLGWSRLPSTDTPPWWHWREKKWIYYGGEIDARSHESSMFLILAQFHELDGRDIAAMGEPWRHVRTYIHERVQPPAYPFPIDKTRARRGYALFHGPRAGCSGCHGRYAESGFPRALMAYETPVIRLEKIGTDPTRVRAMSDAFLEKYNSIPWFSAAYPARTSRERPVGYVAPPLRGIWATAPYLHNGSVPTVAHLLSPGARPRRFYRLPTTDREAYDTDNLGWKFVDCRKAPCDPNDLPYARMLYDTSWTGLANSGHRFGGRLSVREKRDVIEFLKTL